MTAAEGAQVLKVLEKLEALEKRVKAVEQLLRRPALTALERALERRPRPADAQTSWHRDGKAIYFIANGKHYYVRRKKLASPYGWRWGCFRENEEVGHAIDVPFADRSNAAPVPAEFGPRTRGGVARFRWTVRGTSLADLTIMPSIDVGTPSCWHGHITNGEIT